MAAGRLSGKVAIVTGAGRGNGGAIARLFAAEGAQVLAVDLDGAVAAKTVDDITTAGGTASAFTANVSLQADNQAIAAAAIERYGHIDVVCANAGIYPPATLDTMREQDWDRVLGVNLKSVLFAVQAALPHLKAQRSGRIVVTSSITGPKVGIPGLTHYAASKGGINGFIRSAALELAPFNITINAVEPGTILTEGVKVLMTAEDIATLAQAIPLKKLGDPEDVAFAMLFLASDEARYITGQTLVVDGGQILPESKLAILQ